MQQRARGGMGDSRAARGKVPKSAEFDVAVSGQEGAGGGGSREARLGEPGCLVPEEQS